MAWTFKLVSVTTTVAGTDESGNPITVDVSKNGRFVATVDIFSDTAATAKEDTRSYDFPNDIDKNTAVARITADVARMRDARQRVVDLTPNIGQKVVVP